MKNIVITNRKGGVGKTTTAFQLAYWLAAHNRKTLLIDMDPQGNLTKTASKRKNLIGTYDLLLGKEDINDIIDSELGDNKPDLLHADNELSRIEGVLLTANNREYRLKEALDKLKVKYDYVIIDTPPSLSVLTQNAMVASNHVVITAQADTYSTSGLMDVYDDIEAVKKYRNPNLTIEGILLTRFVARTKLAEQSRRNIKEIAAKMGTKVFFSTIRETTIIRESQAVEKSIFEYAEKSEVAKDYERFINELLGGMRSGQS